MTTLAKPSNWQPLDLDDTRKLYDLDLIYPGGIAELVALASPSTPKAAALLSDRLREIIIEFRVDLHFEGRAKTAQIRAALRESPVATAIEWLDGLDADTRRVLAAEAHWEIPDPQRKSDFVDGDMRLRGISAELECLKRCVVRAERRLEPGKRQRRQSVHAAVERLKAAWTAANGGKPTLSSPASGRSTGPFLDFVRAVL